MRSSVPITISSIITELRMLTVSSLQWDLSVMWLKRLLITSLPKERRSDLSRLGCIVRGQARLYSKLSLIRQRRSLFLTVPRSPDLLVILFIWMLPRHSERQARTISYLRAVVTDLVPRILRRHLYLQFTRSLKRMLRSRNLPSVSWMMLPIFLCPR